MPIADGRYYPIYKYDIPTEGADGYVDLTAALDDLGISGGGGGSTESDPLGLFRGVMFNNSASTPDVRGMQMQQIGGSFSVFSSTPSGGPPCYVLNASSGTCYLTDASATIALDYLTKFEAWAALGQTNKGRAWIGGMTYGSMDNATPSSANVLAFRFDSAVDSHWKAVCLASGGGSTVVDTGISPNGNFHKFAIKPDGSGGWDFFIDGTNVANIPSGSSGLPSSGGLTPGLFIDHSNSGNNSTLNFNYFGWWA
jgi:hypothetical protein